MVLTYDIQNAVRRSQFLHIQLPGEELEKMAKDKAGRVRQGTLYLNEGPIPRQKQTRGPLQRPLWEVNIP